MSADQLESPHEYDSADYWKGRAVVRQGIINHLSRKLKRAHEKIDQLQAGE